MNPKRTSIKTLRRHRNSWMNSDRISTNLK
jgi:hypothetical protein